jgi:3-hydroxybenzoate 6-monooxygenase
VVHYPVSNWKYFNLAFTCDDGAREAVTGVPVSTSHVRRQFAPMCDQIGQLIDCFDDWNTWVVCDRDPMARWADGRVVLVVTPPIRCSSTRRRVPTMALEDAVFLGHLLADEAPDFSTVFDGFESRRPGRVQLISRLVRDMVCHPQGERARRRTELLSAMPYRDLYDEFSWLYGTNDATPVPGGLLDPRRDRKLTEVLAS